MSEHTITNDWQAQTNLAAAERPTVPGTRFLRNSAAAGWVSFTKPGR